MLAPNPFDDSAARRPALEWLQRQLAWEQRLAELRDGASHSPAAAVEDTLTAEAASRAA